jgi:H+-transporting ATPase
MSVTMAIGAYALSLQKAIVSRLSAIEELAGVDVLRSDKTGTLTMNQLTVEKQIPFGSFTVDDVLRDAALATQKSSDDAIDVAVLEAAGSRVDFAQVKQTDLSRSIRSTSVPSRPSSMPRVRRATIGAS